MLDSPLTPDQQTLTAPTADAWVTPDFTVIETGMEVTAYYLNDL
ncbi:pyrroloquinoline quinone precursor peptide PqqA [Streptomyces sp. NPDC005426]